MHIPLDKRKHDKNKTRGLLSVWVAPAFHIQYPIPRVHRNRVICVWRGTVYFWLVNIFSRWRGWVGVRVPLTSFTSRRCCSRSSFAGSWRRRWAGCISRFRVIQLLVGLSSLAFAIMFHWDRGISSLWPGEFCLGRDWCCLFLTLLRCYGDGGRNDWSCCSFGGDIRRLLQKDSLSGIGERNCIVLYCIENF